MTLAKINPPAAALDEGINTPLPLTTALGKVFDRAILRNRWVRPISNMVVAWADKWTRAFAATRHDLLAADNNDFDLT